jgi:hypothetical protein
MRRLWPFLAALFLSVSGEAIAQVGGAYGVQVPGFPYSGGALTGPLSLTPGSLAIAAPAAGAQVLYGNATITGAFSSQNGGAYYLGITDQGSTHPFVGYFNGLYVVETPGTSSEGTKAAIGGTINVNATTADNAAGDGNPGFTAVRGVAHATATLGGGVGTEYGSIFGGNAYGWCDNGATNMLLCTGMEIDISVTPGASVARRYGLIIANQSPAGGPQGSVYDDLVLLANNAAAFATWDPGSNFS